MWKEQDINKDKIIEFLVKKDEHIEQLLKQNHELLVKLSETNTNSLINYHNTIDSNHDILNYFLLINLVLTQNNNH